MKVKKNDTVLVLTGKDKTKTGKVITALPQDNKVIVEGINVQKRSKKARSAKETSGIVEQFGAIDASNVMVICPVCGKATRVSYKLEGDKKVRICKKCGASLEASQTKAAKKATKTTAKKTTTKKTADKAENAEKVEKKTTRKKKADAE